MRPLSPECARSDRGCSDCPRTRDACNCKCHIPKPPRWVQTLKEMKK